MSIIKWNKCYSLKGSGKFFKILVSEHETSQFFGTVIHYEEINQGMNTKLDIKGKQFLNFSEEELMSEINKWVTENLHGDFIMTLEEQNNFK